MNTLLKNCIVISFPLYSTWKKCKLLNLLETEKFWDRSSIPFIFSKNKCTVKYCLFPAVTPTGIFRLKGYCRL